MTSLELLQRIAEIEFSTIVIQSDTMGSKLRLLLTDNSYVDVWVSRKLSGRFGFHWERRHLDDTIYRYDNFPDVNWVKVTTFPFHFHDGSQNNVVSSPFAPSLKQGFRDFMKFIQQKMTPPQ